MNVPEDCKVQIGELKEFLKDKKVVDTEVHVINEKDGYVGTYDALVYSKEGGKVLVDYKTGKSIHQEVELQLSAYLLASGLIDCRLGALHLPFNKPGTFYEMNYRPDEFLACLKLFNWMVGDGKHN